MDADDLKKIEVIFQRNAEAMSERFERTVSHQMGVLSEDFQHKLDIVVEGHQMLSEKIDRLEVSMDSLETKVGSVAADLSAHRADTEAHHGVYRVRESGE